MGYRTLLEASAETVQDQTLSAARRLDEATALFVHARYHTSIYLGGLAAEMFLKTACLHLRGATLTTPMAACLAPIKSKTYKPPFKTDYEAGHGLWFWSQELISLRVAAHRKLPNRFLQVAAGIYDAWFIGMRYRPGGATASEAASFLHCVEWIADHHNALRS